MTDRLDAVRAIARHLPLPDRSLQERHLMADLIVSRLEADGFRVSSPRLPEIDRVFRSER